MDMPLLFLICSALIIDKGDASTYHVTFLGRDNTVSLDQNIGELRYRNADVSITSDKPECTVAATSATEVRVATFEHSTCPDIIPHGNELEKKGIKVESDVDFTLHVHQSNAAGDVGDGYLAIPDEHLGDEYFVATYCALGGKCQFAITAVEDDTDVSVVFPNPMVQSAACVNGMPIPSNVADGTAVPFLINEYETLHFESEIDFTGVYITASNKVAVVVGARDVPAATADGAGSPITSNMIEQIIPVNKWGNEFVVIPNPENLAGDVIVIVTKTDNTVVHIIGFTPFVIEHAGDSVVKRIDWQVQSWIYASNPVMVIQVMSVDLYNDANDVHGLPSMLLVPHTKQWTTDLMYLFCNEQPTDILDNLITLVTHNDDTDNADIDLDNDPDWLEVEASDYKTYTGKELGNYVKVTGGKVGGYGTCKSNSAFLLGADWSEDNTECIPTAPEPGDDVDNDCNGHIDDVQCTIDDLVVSFDSEQDASIGEIELKKIAVRGVSKVKFKVSTCDVAMVQLRTVADPPHVLTIAISPQKIVHVDCSPKCGVITEIDNSAIEGACSGLYPYELSWGDTAVLNLGDPGDETLIESGAPEFDEMIMSAFVGSASFEVSLLEKDCAKLYLGDGVPDSYGAAFLIPVTHDDVHFDIVLTNVGNTEANFTVLRDNTLTETSVLPQTSVWFSKSDIIETTYNGIKLTVEGGGQVSVYVFRKAPGSSSLTTGFSVIPTDVLGPSYHMFATNMSTPADGCDIFALTTNTEVKGLDEVHEDDSVSHIPADTDSGFTYRRLLQGERPISVFCGNQGKSYAQMPPRETLGEKHFIPPIDLVSLGDATAKINIVAAEDSTVVVIKGDYHQLDSVSLTGEEYHRDLEAKMIYDITATKPIQVHLEIRGTTWESVVVIPPVEHYTDDFTMFGTLNKPGDYIFHVLLPLVSAISDTGDVIEGVDVQIAPAGPTLELAPYTVPLGFKGFVMVFILSNDKYYVLTNQRNYADINEVCVVTPGQPGDDIDNDCDGLVDEEECSQTVITGEIDVDIDGGLNEDCKNGTNGPDPASNSLSIDFAEIPCATGGGNGAPSGGTVGGTDGDGSGGAGDESLIIGGTTTSLDDTGEEPTELSGTSTDIYHPLAIYSAEPSIATNMPTTTPAPGSTAAPEEYCQAICPCAWVEVQNYTAAEIEEKVEELIEKLTVSKEGLSSTVRKKISASDERPTATTVGWVGVVWLATMIGTIVILDVTSIVRDLKQLVHNLRQMFPG